MRVLFTASCLLVVSNTWNLALVAQPRERFVSHMLLANEEKASTARNEILAQGGGKKAFRQAVRKYSMDVRTKRLGGDLGWVRAEDGRYDPAFVRAVFEADLSRVPKPFKTQFGWHLIFVSEERSAGAPADKEPAADEPPEEKPGPKAVRIVNRYLRAVGGKDAFRAIRDRTEHFSNTKHTSRNETAAAIRLFQKRGVKIREEWDVGGFQIKGQSLQFVQIYDGDQGWVEMFGQVSPLEGRTLSVFVWDKYIDDFFLHWEADGYRLEHVGQVEVEGKPTDHVLATDFTDRQQARYFFLKENGLLVKKEWQDAQTDSDTKEHRQVLKAQYYREYTKIPFADGSAALRLPKRLEIYTDGVLDTVRVYNKITFNTALSDDLFNKPAGKPVGAPPGD